jgi:hypothetical protein
MAKIVLLAYVLFLTSIFPSNAAPPAQHFQLEPEAQRHCPKDTVVWVNTKTGIYHLRGERWYGRTKDGAYVYRKEADTGGDQMTRKGQ